MRKRIFCICLAVAMLVLMSSCQNDENENLIREATVASSSVAGNVSAANSYAKSINAQHVEFSSDSDAVVAVLNGKADYVVLDEYTGFTFLRANKSLSFYEKCDYTIEYSACFSYDNTELCDDFNAAIAKLNEDGTIDKIKSAVNNQEIYVTPEPTGDKGTLIMLCDPIYDNRLYFDGAGEPAGTEVYIAKEICNYLGYTLVIKTVSSEDMFMSLDNGAGDFIMSCVERVDQRAEQYLFSNTYAIYDYNVYKLK